MAVLKISNEPQFLIPSDEPFEDSNENGIFDEYAGCTKTNIDITNKEKIIESLGMVKNCKDVEFTILGISLSGLNFLTSLLIVLFSLRALVYEKD